MTSIAPILRDRRRRLQSRREETHKSEEAGIEGTVGLSFRDPSRTEQNALEKASEQALDTVEVALGGGGLLGGFDPDEAKGLRAELENLLANHRLDGKPLDREWKKKCLAEWKAARKAGMFSAASEPLGRDRPGESFEQLRSIDGSEIDPMFNRIAPDDAHPLLTRPRRSPVAAFALQSA